jgi:hypothetical protein
MKLLRCALLRLLPTILLLPMVDAFAQNSTNPLTLWDMRELFNPATQRYLLVEDWSREYAGLVDSARATPRMPTGQAVSVVGLLVSGPALEAASRTAGIDYTKAKPVCRFYSPQNDTHSFVIGDEACARRKLEPAWIYEGLAFKAFEPAQGACPERTAPVYAVHNGDWRVGRGSNRYTAEPGSVVKMLEAGWQADGVAFCAVSRQTGGIRTYAYGSKYSSRDPDTPLLPARQCLDGNGVVGDCVGFNDIVIPTYGTHAPYSGVSTMYLPITDPNWGPDYIRFTGYNATGAVSSSKPPNPNDTFYSYSSNRFTNVVPRGFHLSVPQKPAAESHHLRGVAIAHRFALPDSGGSASADVLYPWRQLYFAPELRISAKVRVPLLRRGNPGDIYGHPTLEFLDTRSKRRVKVTISAFGTVPEADFFALDAQGTPIVSTTFRPRPAFGASDGQSFVPCAGAPNSGLGGCGDAGGSAREFAFTLNVADFKTVLYCARLLVPELSNDPQDYVVHNFHFNAEIVGGGRLGFSVDRLALDVIAF